MYISTLPLHYLNLFSLPTSGAEIYIGLFRLTTKVYSFQTYMTST